MAGPYTYQAQNLTLWQVPIFAKPTALPCGRSLYLPSPPSYLMTGSYTCKTHHLTLWQVPILAKPTNLLFGRSLHLPIPPSYFVTGPCTCLDWNHIAMMWQLMRLSRTFIIPSFFESGSRLIGTFQKDPLIFKTNLLIDNKCNRRCPYLIVTYMSQLLIIYHSTTSFFLYKVILPTPSWDVTNILNGLFIGYCEVWSNCKNCTLLLKKRKYLSSINL